MSKVLENKLIKEFKDRKYFTREELFDFYQYFEPDLKEGTFGWRIYNLKNRNIIKTLKTGLYLISNKPDYKPTISNALIKLATLITGHFDDINHCIWETAWLNEFSQHQTSRSMLFAEVEKGFEESLYYELRDNMSSEVFLNPDEKTIDFYIAESYQPIIVKNLLTRAPLSKRTKKKITFYTPTLEKILVDLYSEKKLFYFVQGSELIRIYENAITNYSINFTKLFSYAKRRERGEDIRQFMTTHMSHLVEDIIDD